MFQVLTPPKNNDEKMAETAKEVLKAAIDLGGEPMDVEGFLFAWVGGTRVVVQRDDSTQAITGVCIFQAGKRWTENATTAHVLRIDGNREDLLVFVTTLCQAIGATKLYVPEDGFVEQPDGTRIHIVREYPVG